MKYIRAYKLLLSVAIIGSIICFLGCVRMAFYSIGNSIGGHGEGAVLASKQDGKEAELFFLLSMTLLLVAVVLLLLINKAKAKNSGQIK